VYDLPLKLKLGRSGFQEIQKIFVDFGTGVDEVEFVRFVRSARTLSAYSLFIVDAKEL
jgi:hypothetical protein